MLVPRDPAPACPVGFPDGGGQSFGRGCKAGEIGPVYEEEGSGDRDRSFPAGFAQILLRDHGNDPVIPGTGRALLPILTSPLPAHHSFTMSCAPGDRIRSLAYSLGADYYGVADLAPARDFILRQGGERIARYPRAISIGMQIPGDVVELVPAGDAEAAVIYRHSGYEVLNVALDQVAIRVARELRRAGYHALPVPASGRTDDREIRSVFSHKIAAHLAGLGWIGKSCLLVTPDNGPRARWVSVLTDAPLGPTGTPMEPRCGNCTACADICPKGAITGRMFDPSEPREARLDAAACDRYFREMEAEKGVAVCGLCLYVCPHGKNKAAGERGTHQGRPG